MGDFLKLGIIKNKHTDKIINHRSLLKIILNPSLRMFGITLGTNFNYQTQQIVGAEIFLHRPHLNLLHNLNCSWI